MIIEVFLIGGSAEKLNIDRLHMNMITFVLFKKLLLSFSDDDLITISDSSELSFAIQCSRILRLVLFGKSEGPDCLQWVNVKQTNAWLKDNEKIKCCPIFMIQHCQPSANYSQVPAITWFNITSWHSIQQCIQHKSEVNSLAPRRFQFDIRK